jgi:hypothetical protein
MGHSVTKRNFDMNDQEEIEYFVISHNYGLGKILQVTEVIFRNLFSRDI